MDKMTTAFYLAMARLRLKVGELLAQPAAEHDVDLESREGEGGILWTILTVSLVAGIAALFLGPLGTRLKDLGAKSLADVDSAKTW